MHYLWKCLNFKLVERIKNLNGLRAPVCTCTKILWEWWGWKSACHGRIFYSFAFFYSDETSQCQNNNIKISVRKRLGYNFLSDKFLLFSLNTPLIKTIFIACISHPRYVIKISFIPEMDWSIISVIAIFSSSQVEVIFK